MRLKPIHWILTGSVVLLLAAAAFFAVRLINARPTSTAGQSGVLDAGRVNPGSGKKPGVSITFDPAPGLPGRAADLVGTVTRTQDNSVFVSPMSKLSSAQPPPEEVVVVKETKLYRDATLDNQPPPSQSAHLQQVVEQIPVTRIAPQNVLEVWGARRGERWIADVIVVHDR